MNQNILDPVISIGTLADKVGLSVSAIRKYEEEGLIISHRTDSGHRMFSYEDIDRIRVIQHMIKNIGLNIEGIRRMQALLPCWDLLPCENKMRDNCPSFKDNTMPCWTINDVRCAPQGIECRLCPVYRFGSQCTEDMKHVLYTHKSKTNKGDALSQLLKKNKN